MYHCICNKNVERNFFCTKSDPFTLLSHALGSRTDVNEGGHQPQGITTTTYNDYLSQQVHRLVSSFILKASSTQQLQKHIAAKTHTCPHDHFANHQYMWYAANFSLQRSQTPLHSFCMLEKVVALASWVELPHMVWQQSATQKFLTCL